MRLQSLPCFSSHPYIKKDQARDQNDKFFQTLTYAVKDGDNITVGGKSTDPYLWVVKEYARKCEYLEPDSDLVLVPVPRSSITPQDYKREHWPAYKLALALFQARLGAKVSPVLRRVKSVKTSNQSKPDERTTVEEHTQSLKVTVTSLAEVSRVLLVDDVLTRGTQMMGALRALRRAGYKGEVVGFTAGYTIFPDAPRQLNVRSKVMWREGLRYAWHDAVTPGTEHRTSTAPSRPRA